MSSPKFPMCIQLLTCTTLHENTCISFMEFLCTWGNQICFCTVQFHCSVIGREMGHACPLEIMPLFPLVQGCLSRLSSQVPSEFQSMVLWVKALWHKRSSTWCGHNSLMTQERGDVKAVALQPEPESCLPRSCVLLSSNCSELLFSQYYPGKVSIFPVVSALFTALTELLCSFSI